MSRVSGLPVIDSGRANANGPDPKNASPAVEGLPRGLVPQEVDSSAQNPYLPAGGCGPLYVFIFVTRLYMVLHADAVRPICGAISSYLHPFSTIFVSLLLSVWLQQYSARRLGIWPHAACVSRGLLAGFRDDILRELPKRHRPPFGGKCRRGVESEARFAIRTCRRAVRITRILQPGAHPWLSQNVPRLGRIVLNLFP